MANTLLVSHVLLLFHSLNPLSANPTKWSNTLKQFLTNCLSVFDHFMNLALKGLKAHTISQQNMRSLKNISHVVLGSVQ